MYQDQGRPQTRDDVYDPDNYREKKFTQEVKPVTQKMQQPPHEEEFAPPQKVMQSKLSSQAFSNKPQPTEMRGPMVTRNPEKEPAGQLVKVMSN